MVYNRIRRQYVIRVTLILLTTGFLTYSILQAYPLILALGLIVLLFLQAYGLLHVFEQPQRDLARFFDAIEYSDFSQSFSAGVQDKSLETLRATFNRVIQKFQKIRAESEAQYRYFQTVVQHIGVGIIVFTEDGAVDMINQRAKKMLGVPALRKIDQLGRLDPNLPGIIAQMESGERTRLQVRRQDSGDAMTLFLHATEFIIQNSSLKLVSVQNIQDELQEKEFEAWQNLIRVLTHEIMNSVTPISSLASTANKILEQARQNTEERSGLCEMILDAKQAVQTIDTRSQGLLRFVESYRKLTRIPEPEFGIVAVRDLFDRVVPLMQVKFDERGIRFTQSIEPRTLEITADINLIEQVLINLLQNALDWVGTKPDGKIHLNASIGDAGRVLIQVIDNGPGIQKEALEKIFIPFFTTKRDGSGIGLSISRQIMQLHHGSISAVSESDRNTVFTLRF